MHEPPTEADLSDKILTIRGQKVILDRDLAVIYGVEDQTPLNQAVMRNKARFPEEFAFLLTAEAVTGNRSQIVIGSGKHRDRRYPLRQSSPSTAPSWPPRF